MSCLAPGSATGALCGLMVAAACASEQPAPTCLTNAFGGEIATQNIDKVDLLLVLDDSPSMAEKQPAIRQELLRLVGTLVTGERPGAEPFQPVADLHVGVVTADLAGPNTSALTGCGAGGDGILQLGSEPGACGSHDQPFLSYAGRGLYHPLLHARPDESRLLADLECALTLDADGCGAGQPLEAALKALWPNGGGGAAELVDPDSVVFVDGSGHGDRENAGFLRNDPLEGISLLAVLVVTDGDDCSVVDADLTSGAAGQSPEARCVEQAGGLSRLERYIAGLRALRTGLEKLVLFSAIAGVPPDLVSADARAAVALDNDGSRDAYYDGILADPRMQERVQSDGTLAPACERAQGTAIPARRLAEVARQFGDHGALQSICDDDWSGAIDGIIEALAKQLGSCFPRRLRRAPNGRAACNVVWELPPPDAAPEGALSSCDEREFLSRDPRSPSNSAGGERCVVHQLAVTGAPDAARIEDGEGWFYDDFTAGPHCCGWPERGCSEIFFSDAALPPRGVTVRLECLEVRYALPSRDDLDPDARQPEVFDPCTADDGAACQRILADPEGGPERDGIDRGLFCHPERGECVLDCAERRCPAGWRCNDADPAFCEPLECRVPG